MTESTIAQQLQPDETWWKNAVVYQVYPRSFADANGDGVGDLPGICRHLDYIQQLGVDAIWISPIYRSPMMDAGYDVSDHCDVDPLFGTLADVDALIAEAHARKLRVLLDFVPNHTSDQHPWFVQARSSRNNPYRDWYIWRDAPNRWRSSLGGGSAWTLDEHTGQYYLHFFLPQQPDLNWRNPEVIEAMHNVLRFWLNRGVDGFRIDVAHCIGKDPEFADHPVELADKPLVHINDQPHSHELLRGIRQVVEDYPGDRVLVGEVNIRSTTKVAQYYGRGDELHMSFNFPPLDLPWDAEAFRQCIREVDSVMHEAQAWPTWVLSNHDNPRHRTRYGGSGRRARAAAVMLLTLRGTPFVFQGEELGLEDALITPETQVDPGGRDGARAPMPWLARPPHGWGAHRAWLPFPPDAGVLSVECQHDDPASTLNLYRQLLRLRRERVALRLGEWHELPSAPELLAYRRRYHDDECRVCINFGPTPQLWDVAAAGLPSNHGGTRILAKHADDGKKIRWRVVVSSLAGTVDERFQGEVPPECGLVLVPDS